MDTSERKASIVTTVEGRQSMGKDRSFDLERSSDGEVRNVREKLHKRESSLFFSEAAAEAS
jgi:hypothetical protein